MMVVPSPGRPGGPCRRMHCGGEGCELLREIAGARCSICRDPIGYETRYVEVEGTQEFEASVFTHELCAVAQEARSPTT